MTPDSETCDSGAIERYLSGELAQDQQRSLESHLDACQACCDRIGAAAASDDQWRDVRGLSSVDLDDRPPRPEHAPLDFLSPTDDPRMLGRFAGYEIAGVIGQGGMGLVLKAFDPALNRYSAIKVLAPHYASSGAARKRFAREAQAAAAVVHENVIAIHGVGEAAGLPYLVMPYVRGESLQKRIDREGPLPIDDVLRISLQSAAGLAAAHDQGLVHRDIKPANILLADGAARVLITDFGLARAADDASLTRSGVIAGTPQYMSPEQARGEAIDGRSDLFSLGSVIYVAATGRIPFRAETPFGILRRITDHDPRPMTHVQPGVPAWLDRLVSRLHAKSPPDRFESARQLSGLLGECLTHVQTPTKPLPPELVDRPSRVKWTACLAIAALLALIAVIAAQRSKQKAPIDVRWQPSGDSATESLISESQRLLEQTATPWPKPPP